uniref:Golgi associated, gamma adaptin ear containing, ARF binding protein 3a n=1 Tax=Cyprinus carpio carpio TaxID=630221 RepID=A0A9J8C5K3_CYPCA
MDGFRMLLHFDTDHPPGLPDVLVIVVSMLNTAPVLVRNVVLQAAVPKGWHHLRSSEVLASSFLRCSGSRLKLVT